MSFFDKNLILLEKHDPALASRVKSHGFSGNIKVHLSRDGLPIPQVSGISLHSQYYPIKEAEKISRDFKVCDDSRTVVFGLGFGYHILPLLKLTEVTVIEPFMFVFRAFMENVDLAPFYPGIRFRIAEKPATLLARLEPSKWNIFKHTPSIRIGEPYYQQLKKGISVRKFIFNKSLRILVVKPIYGGSLPTANHCFDALKNLGHEVESVDCDKFSEGFFSLKDATIIKENSEILSQKFFNLMGEITAAKAAEFQPDLILALAQAPLSSEAILRLKDLDIPIAFWFVEDFRTLVYWKEVAHVYDHFFTIQNGKFHSNLKTEGVKDAYYLPQAANPVIHRPLSLPNSIQNKCRSDISFMGAAYHNRVQSFPRLLDKDFKIWGTGWNPNTVLGNRLQNNNKRVTTEETVYIYNATKINLNLHSSSYHYGINPEGDFVNPRTFEIAACKGFQLVDYRSDLINLFHIKDEVTVFRSLDELKDQIDFYLNKPDLRKIISERSYQRVLKEHTFEHRMQEMLIHIFINRLKSLENTEKNKVDPLAYCISRAGEDTHLGRYLKEFKGQKKFSLKNMANKIQNGEGALDDNETLIMMIDQLIEEES